MSKVRRIIETYFNNAYTGLVQKKFSSWFRNREDEEKNRVLKGIWDELEIPADRSTEKSFRKLKAELNPVEGRTFADRVPLKSLGIRIAAVLLVAIVSVSITYFYMEKYFRRPEKMELVECIVPAGETRSVVLPDSSKITLNAGSTLIYPKDFNGGEKREVYLNGEAYFAVVHNGKKPFIVKTTDFDVQVLGTVFDVSSYTENKLSSVSLEKGRVGVSMKNGKNGTYVLCPDEQIRYDRETGQVQKKTVNIGDFTGWKERYLIIQALSIGEMLDRIERKYGVKVYLNTNKYDDEKITAKFIDGENIQHVFHVLKQLIPGMKYRIEGNGVYIN